MRKIDYLASANEDLRWFYIYYSMIFPAGGAKAADRLAETEALLLDNPLIGPPTGISDLRKRKILKTPFTLVYRTVEDGIEVIRVLDDRSE